ncbi:MAG: hypothetical protein Terrestrivirus3_102 [Terrestrivirus sp.]|jgi:hypothetical protein|uniref:Uncharacterized protein n=1 Tax=Terrestrivirus sp. TaxID=2487775 RepID=A0A3G4ZQE2_9VIRU|nr:MAG: hypothetical protein Terrestrivirus3_102 [Terrestrivirus sp.]
MYLEIFKNPILLGVIAGCLTYLYLLWQSDSMNKNIKSQKKRDENTKKSISLFLPLVAAIIVCIIAYAYFYINPDVQLDQSDADDSVMKSTATPKYKFAVDEKSVSSESATSFHLISKGMNIPNKPLDVPDVFIETYD